SFLDKHAPVLILMDEVLEYAVKAAGERVGESTMAGQTIAFMQEITEAVVSLKQVCLLATLPASIIEHYDEGAERLFQQLQKVSGRIEKIYTPVEDSEITKVIRKRLFSSIDEKEAKKTVLAFVDYAEKENIIPAGVMPSEYKNRFLDSYPFIPDMIDILYHRWGTFPGFQRTRGVLRLLSLLIHSVKNTNLSYITLSDFNLANQEIRQEFIKHIGNQFNGIIDKDISGEESGARKVDGESKDSYKGLNIGYRTSTVIFLYSFSGGFEHGATIADIKRSASFLTHPSSIISEALEQLKNRLFYLQNQSDKYLFNNQPNLNRIILDKMENIKDEDLLTVEKDLLKTCVSSGKFKIYIWDTDSSGIADTEDLKLIILSKEDRSFIEQVISTKGQTPRVYRNTMFFLYPVESEKYSFTRFLKRKIAYELIGKDNNLLLSDEQKKTITSEIKRAQNDIKSHLLRFYRIVVISGQGGELKIVDLGIPTYGDNATIDKMIYDKMRANGEILEHIAPVIIREKYLIGKDYAPTEQIYQATLNTPGEARMINKDVLKFGVQEGVKNGLFGLGDLENDRPVCRYFKENPNVSLCSGEIIIKESICKEQKKKEKEKEQTKINKKVDNTSENSGTMEEETQSFTENSVDTPKKDVLEKLEFRFMVPKGKMSQLMGTFGFLQTKFDRIYMTFSADYGKITRQEVEDKVKETFIQLGIDLDEFIDS
ncbi:MAG: DUF499 domain-containing protein, partial [Desulfobacterales bacterium]|nr:DUF499 domain-containing protein [Desulfobacterales bacterium]